MGKRCTKTCSRNKKSSTPIQLTIDQLKSKYIEKLPENEKSKYDEYLKTIYKQIKQIENLVNEFSDFARMPKPILKKIIFMI